jgi:hypothetical protein
LKVFGKQPIKAISTDDIRKALNHYAQGKCLKGDGAGKSRATNKPRSSNTVLRLKAVLSSIFKYAIRRGYLKDNPVEGIFIDAAPNQVERFLDDRERQVLLSACRESTWDKLYLVVLMAITTGMRKSEMMNLRWTDINFDKGLASITVVNYVSACAVDSGRPEPRLDGVFATATSRRCARPWADTATAIATTACALPEPSAGLVLPPCPGLLAQPFAVFLATAGAWA